MTVPSRVSSDDLVGWSNTAGASSTLPVLVRRLIRSEVASGAIAFRGDAGVQLPGVDGSVVVTSATDHVPNGSSFWELSVERGVKGKLDSDYKKRTKETPASVRRQTAYVAVTSRRYASATTWLAAKRRGRAWREIRLLDADDLAAWLDESTVVSSWFAATHLQRPSSVVTAVDKFIDDLCRRTRPVLPVTVLLAGRDDAAAQVRAWAIAAPSLLRIQGETREEACAFAAAVLMREASVADRALVASTREGLDWALTSHRPAIVLANFPEYEHGGGGLTHHLLIAYGAGASPRDAVCLDPIPRDELRQTLGGVFDSGAAHRFAMRSGGSLGALQRLMGVTLRPSFAMGGLTAERRALLLAGAWCSGNEADQAALVRLSGGRTSEDIAAECVRLAAAEGAPVRRREDAWCWRSPEDAWRLFSAELSEQQFAPFWSVAQAVLGEPDPLAGASDDERSTGIMRGNVRRHSEALRSGMAEVLARLAQHSGRGGPSAQAHNVARAVRLLLPEGWRAWASLHDQLPILCEAAPGVFLDQLAASLRSGDDGVARLIAMETGIWGQAPHVGLLWALERLAWSSARLSRVAHLLGQLDAHDPGGRQGNRPLSTLRMLFRDIWPQTQASDDDRLRVLRELVTDLPPRTTWRLLLGLVPDRFRGVLGRAARPEHLEPVPEQAPKTLPLNADYWRGISALLCDVVGVDVPRWAELFRRLPGAPGLFIADALRVANERVAQLREHAGAEDLRQAVRHMLRALRNAAHQQPATNFEQSIIDAAQCLHDALRIHDPVGGVAWLFDFRPELVEDLGFDWQRETARAQELRCDALRAVLTGHGRPGLVALVTQVPQPSVLGVALANEPAADEHADFLLSEPFGHLSKRLQFLHAFVPARAARIGGTWLRDALVRLMNEGRVDEATESCVALPPVGGTWDLLEAVSEDLAVAYWRSGPMLMRGLAAPELERGIGNLLRANRVATALEAASMSFSNGEAAISTALAIEVLEQCRAQAAQLQSVRGGSTMLGYHVAQVLQRLPDSDELESRLVSLEVFFLALLEDNGGPRRLHRALSRDGRLWASLVSMTVITDEEFRSGRRGVEDSSPEERARSETAWRVLEGWRGIAGAVEGVFSAARFDEWLVVALDELRARGISDSGLHWLAVVLGRLPSEDGIWPALPARRLVESRRFPRLTIHLGTAWYNSVGVRYGDDGAVEHSLAAGLRSNAERLERQWPLTAAMVRELSETPADEAVLAEARAAGRADP